MGQSQYSAFRLSLEELGLFNLLKRIHEGRGDVDPLMRYSLAKRGLLIDDTLPRLSKWGLLELQRLRERARGANDDEAQVLGSSHG